MCPGMQIIKRNTQKTHLHGRDLAAEGFRMTSDSKQLPREVLRRVALTRISFSW